MGAVRDSASYLAEHMHEAPVLMIPCIEGREDKQPLGGVSFWASLFPAVWSFCLALRSRGLGSCWTTLHLVRGGEEKVADILGIPFEKYSQGGLFPIAYTKGTEFKPAKRLPADGPHALERLVTAQTAPTNPCCRHASYTATAAALARLSDRRPPNIGMRIRSVMWLSASVVASSPVGSGPNINTSPG